MPRTGNEAVAARAATRHPTRLAVRTQNDRDQRNPAPSSHLAAARARNALTLKRSAFIRDHESGRITELTPGKA
jgi:hypothetical protein